MVSQKERAMKLRCLLVDDEPLAVRLISSYIQLVPGLELVVTCSNAMEAFEVLQKQKIDLVFLDIKMPKMLGTDFLRSLPDPPLVIVITAYREYAIDGFELDVVDFLLKPVSFNRFMKAVAKAHKMLSLSGGGLQVPQEQLERQAFLYFKVDKEMTKVMMRDILFIESRKEYVMLHLESKKNLLVKQSITSLEKMLSPHHFVRIHRSYIAAVDKISAFNTAFVMIGTLKLPIGRLYKNQVERRLKTTDFGNAEA
jgi:DNA-binding LytR/AlgR family response regulator